MPWDAPNETEGFTGSLDLIVVEYVIGALELLLFAELQGHPLVCLAL